MLYMKVVKKVNPTSSHHKKENVFFFFYSVSIWDDECSLNILYPFNDVYKLNQYVLYLKHTQCYILIIISQ